MFGVYPRDATKGVRDKISTFLENFFNSFGARSLIKLLQEINILTP